MVTKQAVSKKIFFLKADSSAICNALAMCLQLSLLSCHCSVMFWKGTVKFPTALNLLWLVYIYWDVLAIDCCLQNCDTTVYLWYSDLYVF